MDDAQNFEFRDGDPVEPDQGPTWLGPARLATGFCTGLGYWLITELAKPVAPIVGASRNLAAALSWAELHPLSYAALNVLLAFLPLIALAQMGRMRGRRLLAYLALAGAALASLAIYSIWRAPESTGLEPHTPNFQPPPPFLIAASCCVFIVNQLMEHNERGSGLFRDYANYFEDSWTRGAQFVLSLCFAGLIQLVLLLGGALFNLIHLSFLSELVGKPWFCCPAFGLSFAAAVQITDIRPALLRGSRNLCLTLLSWIVPLMTVIAGGFLVALTFTGLGPLWATRNAAPLLLNADLVMLVSLNAAYKGGEASSLPARMVRYAGLGSVVVMIAFAVIAAYAIALRVDQYGWTPQRVVATALNLIILAYGLGYGWAATCSKHWMSLIEQVNVAASLGVIATALAIFTPIADPARIAVDSQLSRLSSHRVSPERFDYQMLRFDAGQYGASALTQLATSAQPQVRARAARASSLAWRTSADQTGAAPTATEAPLSHAVIYPKGAVLPTGFPADIEPGATPGANCVTDGTPCEIYILRRGGASDLAILVYTPSPDRNPDNGAAALWTKDAHAKWMFELADTIAHCPAALAALRHGDYEIVPSSALDLSAGGLHFPLSRSEPTDCPKSTPKPPPPPPPPPRS